MHTLKCYKIGLKATRNSILNQFDDVYLNKCNSFTYKNTFILKETWDGHK